MNTMIVTLQLSTHFHGRHRQRCPNLVFSIDGSEIASIRSDASLPELPLDDGSVDTMVIHHDALSRVMDEEAWLAVVARVIAPGGELQLTLPASGPFAWLDALNIYRYITDVTRRGDEPDSSRPTGWNRHYSPEAITAMLDLAGLELTDLHRRSHAVEEIGMLAMLLGSNWLRGDRETELRAFDRFGQRSPGKRTLPLPGTTWDIRARKLDRPKTPDIDAQAAAEPSPEDPGE